MAGALSRVYSAVFAVITGVAFVATLPGCGDSSSSSSSDKKGPTVKAAQKFANEYDAAVHRGDVDYRIAHLHPVVLARYGDDQCRQFLSTQTDKTRRTKVKTVGKSEPFEYASDNLSVTIPDTLPVLVKQTIQGTAGDRNIHVAIVDGTYRYFIDCGTPIGA